MIIVTVHKNLRKTAEVCCFYTFSNVYNAKIKAAPPQREGLPYDQENSTDKIIFRGQEDNLPIPQEYLQEQQAQRR